MSPVTPGTPAQDILKALGLGRRKVASMTLRMAVGELVTVDTKEYAEADDVSAFTSVIVERQYKAVRWIPVWERLPDHGEEVLIWHEWSRHAIPAVRATDGSRPYFHTSLGGNVIADYWMPQIEGPK